MKRCVAIFLLAGMWMYVGCGGSVAPPPKTEITDEMRKEIEEHDAQVQQAESAQHQQQAPE